MADDLKKHATDIVTALGELANGEIDPDAAVKIVQGAVGHFDDLGADTRDELVQKIGSFGGGANADEFFLECSGLLSQSAKFGKATLE